MLGMIFKKYSKKAGLPPGSMVYVGERKVDKVKITVNDYDKDNVETKELESVEEAFPFKETSTVTWLNIDGLHEIDALSKIGKYYDIHSLVMEDILNTQQRPKVEIFDDYIFVVMKMMELTEENELKIEQLSIFLGENYVITFQESIGDIFDPLRARINNNKGRLRKYGPDYLFYAVIDIVIDNYFSILEKIGETIEYLDENVIENPDESVVYDIQQVKRKLIFLRKSIMPLRELINRLIREETTLIKESTIPYLRDLYDHTIQVADNIETYRDLVSGILDLYLSNMSNKMNEVMKVLTIIATIFIPLTFIAGVYGMNFEFMPELKYHWGYPFVWSVMGVVFLGMIYYFRRKKWL
ncbi:magnesium/cobalt transporter CorA [candidate division KSB1 bacterium]